MELKTGSISITKIDWLTNVLVSVVELVLRLMCYVPVLLYVIFYVGNNLLELPMQKGVISCQVVVVVFQMGILPQYAVAWDWCFHCFHGSWCCGF